tara:strand:+ start:485 stop:886 length:402 start_codon:yes stop_codon:yes gene_type:complete
MDYNSIIKNYSEEKKDEIVNLAKVNKSEMGLNNLYNNQALNVFFNLWHDHFPNVKQTKSCKGCRKAVCLFFHNVADFISSEKLKAVETANTPNPKRTRKEIREVIEVVKKKSKKVKKHKTVTGALSNDTGPRN